MTHQGVVRSFIGYNLNIDISKWYLLNIPHLATFAYTKAKDMHHMFPSIKPKEEPETVQNYLESEEFAQQNDLDQQFYNKVNNTLDYYIEQIPQFHTTLQQYHNMLQIIEKECTKENYPIENCYWNDNGCMIDCIDKLYPIK